jgi:hypothetical protein
MQWYQSCDRYPYGCRDQYVNHQQHSLLLIESGAEWGKFGFWHTYDLGIILLH